MNGKQDLSNMIFLAEARICVFTRTTVTRKILLKSFLLGWTPIFIGNLDTLFSSLFSKQFFSQNCMTNLRKNFELCKCLVMFFYCHCVLNIKSVFFEQIGNFIKFVTIVIMIDIDSAIIKVV
jgi:hypothetical protein